MLCLFQRVIRNKAINQAKLDFNNLIRVTSKVERRAASIGFVKKALYQEVTPKFALLNA